MEIREAGRRDLDGIVDLWWELQFSHLAYDESYYQLKPERECRELAKRYFQGLIQSERNTILLACESKRIIGMIHIELREKPPIFRLHRFAHIQAAVVAKSHRKRGVFRSLLDHALEKLRADEIHLAELFVDEGNAAVEAYRCCGFSVRQHLMVKWL